MYLLRRKISPYSGYDQILGIARSFELAQGLKDQYIESRVGNDPWREQAYREVDLEKDIIVEDISTFFKRVHPIGEDCFLVCHLEDYMGLCSLKIYKAFESQGTAENYIDCFYKYCDLLEEADDFGLEKIEVSYIKDLRKDLGSDEDDDYFRSFGGELKIYKVQEGVLQKEEAPSCSLDLQESTAIAHQTFFEKVMNYLKKRMG